MTSNISKAVIFFSLFLLIFSPFAVSAQETDTLETKIKWFQRKSFKVAAVPTTLAIAGISTLAAKDHTTMSKYNIHREFQKEFPPFETRIDDQLRYVPIAIVYGLNLVGKKGNNAFVERSLILTKSFLLEHLLVSTMKNGFNMERPSGGDNSFPSSHTARAFVAATFMHYEFGDQSLWYSIAGYSFAVATGALRMVNNHHWLPDVLVGAGIGILSTKLAYLTHQYKYTKWMKILNGKNLTLLPTYTGSAPGVYLQIKL